MLSKVFAITVSVCVSVFCFDFNFRIGGGHGDKCQKWWRCGALDSRRPVRTGLNPSFVIYWNKTYLGDLMPLSPCLINTSFRLQLRSCVWNYLTQCLASNGWVTNKDQQLLLFPQCLNPVSWWQTAWKLGSFCLLQCFTGPSLQYTEFSLLKSQDLSWAWKSFVASLGYLRH